MGKKKGSDRVEATPEEVGEALSSSVLREMVNALEETKLGLLLSIKELKDKLAQQKEDQADIYYYLNKKCDESFEVIGSLEEQLMNEQADREVSDKAYEDKIEDLKQSAHNTENKLLTKIGDLENRLEMLSLFATKKEELEKKTDALVSAIEEQKISAEQRIDAIEGKNLLEKEKTRKTYDHKFESIRKELELTVDSKLSKKTKKTQVANILMKKELNDQSKHAEKLLEINQAISDSRNELKQELELSRSMQDETHRRLTMYQRMIKQLNEKVKLMEEQTDKEDAEYQSALEKKSQEIAELQGTVSTMSKRLNKEHSQLDAMWSFIARSYQLLTRGKQLAIPTIHPGLSTPGAATSTLKMSSMPSVSMFDLDGGGSGTIIGGDHERVLVALVKDVLRKYPAIASVAKASTTSASRSASRAQLGPSRSSGGFNNPGLSSASVVSSVSQISYFGPLSRGSVGEADSVGMEGDQSSAGTTAVTVSAGTGIPAWDFRSEEIVQEVLTAQTAKKLRSIATQTEGTVTPYSQASVMLDSPRGRTILGHAVAASTSAGNKQQMKKGPLMLLDSPVGGGSVQSVPSLWGEIGALDGGGSQMSQISVGSAGGQSANYAVMHSSSHIPPTQVPSKTKLRVKAQRRELMGGSAGMNGKIRASHSGGSATERDKQNKTNPHLFNPDFPESLSISAVRNQLPTNQPHQLGLLDTDSLTPAEYRNLYQKTTSASRTLYGAGTLSSPSVASGSGNMHSVHSPYPRNNGGLSAEAMALAGQGFVQPSPVSLPKL